ncbi:ferritin family protein [Thermohalobacter berrensis]|uniref:Rubrerythrin diiron-binding domain-containing protein n=1 Tax=Thermohalobacter berrensis TaxID=99594 RepID=A0A419T1B2_9FIRM|nr:ferritin family protein [Thermohalobacter berrensis]RKD31243.1 hypothetical protein BET03_03705 [Thermohalobacter berrensis]
MGNVEKIVQILKFAQKMEKQGVNFYSHYRDKVKNESVKELFDELVNIEQDHYNLLEKKLNELDAKKDLEVISWVIDEEHYVKSPKIFADNSILDDEYLYDLTVMRIAYLIENDFAEFYKNAAKEVENEAVKSFLEGLAEWEEEHKDLFYGKYQEMLKGNWQDISSYLFSK